MTFWKWSRNAATNATADATCPFPEGMAPSALNDGTRGMMAALAKWRDDMTGTLATGGSGSAYTLSTYQQLTALTDGFTVQFTPAASSLGAVVLSVDGLTSKPVRFRTGVDLPPGALISGSLYTVTYRAAADEWLLHSFDASIYSIPIGASVDFWGATSPNGAFVIPVGQAISRTTYSALFGVIGTAYGPGDGSSTFNLPNPAGRVVAQREAASSLLTFSYFGSNSTVLGAASGSESRGIGQANLPAVNFAVSNGSLTVLSTVTDVVRSLFGLTSSTASTGGALGQFASSGGNQVAQIQSTGTVSGQTAASGGSGVPIATVQPTIIANRLMRVI